MEWEVSENSIRIALNGVLSNCCSTFMQEVTILNNQIILVERDTSRKSCNCTSSYDLVHSINQLNPGKYNVKVYREERIEFGYTSDSRYLVGETDFEIISRQPVSPATFDFQQRESAGAASLQRGGAFPKNVQVYPNPSGSVIALRFYLSRPSDVSVQLFNLLGKEVLKKQLYNFSEGIHTVSLDTIDLPNGMYLGKLSTSDGKIRSFKIVWSR